MAAKKRTGDTRREFVKRSGAAVVAGALAPLPTRVFAQAPARTEVVFASAPFLTKASMDALLAKYNAAQGTVHATYIELPSAGDSAALHDDLVKRLKAPGGPDIYSLDVVWIGEFAGAGLALPLDTYFDATAKAAFFPGILAGCTVGGKLTGLPWFADSGMLFYRIDILDKIGAHLPLTWDDLIATATKGMSVDTPYGFLWQGKRSEALVCNLVSVIGSNGGTVLAADGKTIGIADPPAVAAVQLLYDTINTTKISPKDVLGWDEEPCRTAFTDGKAVFLRNWSYTWGVAQQADSKVAGKIGVAPLPHFPGHLSAACLGGYQYAVNPATKNKNAAIDLLRFLSSAATQLSFAASNGLAPTQRAIFDDPGLAKAQPFLAQLKDVFTGAISRPVTAKYPKVTLALQTAVSAALANGKIAAGLATAKTEVEAALKA